MQRGVAAGLTRSSSELTELQGLALLLGGPQVEGYEWFKALAALESGVSLIAASWHTDNIASLEASMAGGTAVCQQQDWLGIGFRQPFRATAWRGPRPFRPPCRGPSSFLLHVPSCRSCPTCGSHHFQRPGGKSRCRRICFGNVSKPRGDGTICPTTNAFRKVVGVVGVGWRENEEAGDFESGQGREG